MPGQQQVHFTDFFSVDPDDLDAYGAFNISVLTDLPLFVDPFLLFNSPRPDYQQLHEQMIDYLRFLKEMAAAGDIKEGLLREWFVFSEVRENWLGFSATGNRGHGLGMGFARSLHGNLQAVFANFGEEPITRSSHLEKVCLIDEGVGRDKISDFTTNLIKRHLLEYTQTFAESHIDPSMLRTHSIPRVEFNYATESWRGEQFNLPTLEGDYVLLSPRDMLTRDENWIGRPALVRNIAEVIQAVGDQQLRDRFNNYLIQRLPDEPSQKERTAAVNALLLRFPVLIDYFIRNREDSGDEAVDHSQALVGETQNLFVEQVAQLVAALSGATGFYGVRGNTFGEARERLLYLKDLIENKGAYRFFYIDGKPVRRESDLQIAYRLVWWATPSDVGREVDDGRGPADFKISRGAYDKTIVEFKLGSNSQLKRNLEKQAETYQRAADAQYVLKAILCFSSQEQERVMTILTELGLGESPTVIVIDARSDNKPSGSRA